MIMHTVDSRPAASRGTVLSRPAGGAKVSIVALVNVFLRLIAVIAAPDKTFRLISRKMQVKHQVGFGQTNAPVLKRKEPVKIFVPFLLRQFAALMHGVGCGVTVGNQNASVIIEASPSRAACRRSGPP